MKSEGGTGGRHPLLGDVDCHPPISFGIQAGNFGYLFFILNESFHYSNGGPYGKTNPLRIV